MAFEIKLFKKPQTKNDYLGINDGVKGLETYYSPQLFNIHPAFREQIITFLNSVLDEFEEQKKQEQKNKRGGD